MDFAGLEVLEPSLDQDSEPLCSESELKPASPWEKESEKLSRGSIEHEVRTNPKKERIVTRLIVSMDKPHQTEALRALFFRISRIHNQIRPLERMNVFHI